MILNTVWVLLAFSTFLPLSNAEELINRKRVVKAFNPQHFTGLDYWTHGRLVNYEIQNPAEANISNWLVNNPQRINLGTIGFWFKNSAINESTLSQKIQILDLWTGQISSSFALNGSNVNVTTWCDPDSDTLAIQVHSSLLSAGELGIFFDYPYPDISKFDSPSVGVFNAVAKHDTKLSRKDGAAVIQHNIDNTTYFNSITWKGDGQVIGPLPDTHRYILGFANGVTQTQLTAKFSASLMVGGRDYSSIANASMKWWESYWQDGAFIDLTGSSSSKAKELQRRTILSQYLLAINEAPSNNSPQESGLTNNGWYGKFHLEMTLWHLLHWGRWNRWTMLWRSIPKMYDLFLPSSYQRARRQGYDGARWGKMSDPTGRSTPGDINALLIWQQPHPMYFAELEYRSFPNTTTLRKWNTIIEASADFMASYAFYNHSTKVYDLGPPMYLVSENTNENATINPAFEIAYWRFGLDVAITWKERLNEKVPTSWTTVRDNLAPLPTVDSAFAVYEGIPDMWSNNTTVEDHPAITGIYGLLPPPRSGPALNMTCVRNTAEKVRRLWNWDNLYGWDWPLLAMNQLRLGNVNQAVEYLLDPAFSFDDAGYPESNRVPTPYFPGASAFMLAMAMMAGGWVDEVGPHFPEEWIVKVEGFSPGL
ncbi:Six-hairpin glycosidase protein [Rutstroemia sp. NJR-2017a WRK4]|nr:Six-hairpin glycosidase protein [Rutstroemia sp. NJR-2017a WRK4]